MRAKRHFLLTILIAFVGWSSMNAETGTKFMLGCNYWDSASGTDMWRNFSEETIREDIKALAACGVKVMRVFPNWRDFQPVEEMVAWRGYNHGYCTYDEKSLTNPDGIDMKQIEHFRTFAGICKEHGIQLVVSVVTGWMSGRLFVPRVLIGKNPINDPDARMWTSRYIHGFVNAVKDLDNIVMWDLGNECNCMGGTEKRSEAYAWTSMVRNAITAADPSRPVSSGMHGLTADGGTWTIQDQGEITDYLTPHPYVSKSIKNDIEPMNRPRTTILPTAQCVYYSDLGKKPAILQEQGTFSEALGNAQMGADFVRINILSAYAHNVKGYFWWCGMNHSRLTNAPYIWSMIERDLGMVDDARKPKEVGLALRDTGKRLGELPFTELTERLRDATILLTAEQADMWASASAAFVLAKQAGLEPRFAIHGDTLPHTPLYILPCLTGWSVMDKATQDALTEAVQAGATALVTYDGGQFSRFEEFFGLRSKGIVTSQRSHTTKLGAENITYNVKQELLADPIKAQVLARNEEENTVFSCHTYGKGKVYFLNMPLERNLANKYGAFDNLQWQQIYRTVAKDILEKKPITSENPEIAVTIHPQSETSYIACALNYTNRPQKCAFKTAPGYKIKAIQGSMTEIPACNAVFLTVSK